MTCIAPATNTHTVSGPERGGVFTKGGKTTAKV